MTTLWDLLRPIAKAIRAFKATPAIAPAPPRKRQPPMSAKRATPASAVLVAPAPRHHRPAGAKTKKQTAQDHYDQIACDMLAKYGVGIKRWRKSMSGIAYLVRYKDGKTKRLIESPKPKSPLSMSIFLHEIGHHAIGLGIYKPRCLEEYLAWKFSIEQMVELGVPVTEKVQRRMQRSLEYAVAKARRRGIKSIPDELRAYDNV